MFIDFKPRKIEEFDDLLSRYIVVDNKFNLQDFSSDEYYSLCINYLITCYTPMQQITLLSTAQYKLSKCSDMSIFNAFIILMASRGMEFYDLDAIANPCCQDDYWFNSHVELIKNLIISSVKDMVDEAFINEVFEFQRGSNNDIDLLMNDDFYDKCLSENNLKSSRGKNLIDFASHLKYNVASSQKRA